MKQVEVNWNWYYGNNFERLVQYTTRTRAGQKNGAFWYETCKFYFYLLISNIDSRVYGKPIA